MEVLEGGEAILMGRIPVRGKRDPYHMVLSWSYCNKRNQGDDGGVTEASGGGNLMLSRDRHSFLVDFWLVYLGNER